MATPDKGELLARLARAIADSTGASLESRLCRAYLEILGGDGVSLTLADGLPDRVMLHSTDAAATRLDELHEVLGEGPSTQAYRSSTITTLDLHASASAWSTFAAAARASVGELIIHAVPISPAGHVLGVLTAHRTTTVGLPDADIAQFLADAIGTALLHNPDSYLEDLGSWGWSERATIHQATGMVVMQLKLSTTDAAALLRAHAFAHASSLGDVARLVVSRELRFADPDTSTRSSPPRPPRNTDTDTDGGTSSQ